MLTSILKLNLEMIDFLDKHAVLVLYLFEFLIKSRNNSSVIRIGCLSLVVFDDFFKKRVLLFMFSLIKLVIDGLLVP